jgi:DNA mismatch endonuclease (patch repair protein)
MGKIRSKETKIEIDFRKLLSKKGLKYRKNSNKYFGKPDIVFPLKKIAIFIDSCFWHGCKKHCRVPAANRRYWLKKINGNKKRDKRVSSYFKKNGWKVIRIWEHDLKNKEFIKKILNKLK